MRTVLIFLGAALLSLSGLRADVEFAFAVPDDGRITLGVFDGSGKLVRLLHRLAAGEDFRIGLNGFITTWDGRNDAGELLSAGRYHVRGYLVGEEVSVAGEDFLFNDWASDAGFPNFQAIRDFSLLENGDVILLAGDASSRNVLARFSPDKGFLWSGAAGPAGSLERDSLKRTLGSPELTVFPPLLTSNDRLAITVSPAGTVLHALETGEPVLEKSSEHPAPPLSLAANNGEVFVCSEGGLAATRLPLLEGTDTSFPPQVFTTMDASGEELLGAGRRGVWHGRKSFVPVSVPLDVRCVSYGTPGTFWFVGMEAETPVVGQSSFGGEILRLLRPAAEDPKPEKVRASRTSEKIVVLESLPTLQRLRCLVRTEDGGWTIEWERSIQNSSAFGFVDDRAVADAGNTPQEKNLRVRLKENPLTGNHDFLTLHATFDTSGSRLVSPDGLPLVEVSTRNDIRRVEIRRGSDAVRLLQGNGAFVEEFAISGLPDILPIDAGDIELP